MKGKKISIKKILLTLPVLALAILFLLPLLWMLSSSLKTPGQVFESPFRWIPENLRWSNFSRVWTDSEMPFWRLMLNSITISVVSVAGQVVIASMAAYAFAKIQFAGRDFVFMLFLITMMIPSQAMIIPQYMIFYNIGLYDSLFSIILPNWFNVTSIFLLRQFYLALPDELVDAALIDGAGYFKIWSRVMLPLSKNGIVSVVILSFITSWNEFLRPLIFLPSKIHYTVAQGVRWYLNDTAQEYNLVMASAVFAIVPVIILYVCAQNYFEEGIAASGVKG